MNKICCKIGIIKIKVCLGNGMRGPIQRGFEQRFGVRACEIYGATEGNCVLSKSRKFSLWINL